MSVPRRPAPPPLRTYSHLANRAEVPSEYQIVSSRLLYHPERGFEVDVPVAAWYQRHQRGAKLRCDDWDAFADPRATTYAAYTAQAARSEQHLDAVQASAEASGDEARLPEAWTALTASLLSPLRYPWHGFQMLAAYVGQMAPAGRVTLVALFQAADQMRRIHRIADRMARNDDPAALGEAARRAWEDEPAWQPLRQAVEQALVTYDWDEAFAAACLCLQPCIDELTLGELATLARRRGDFVLGETLTALGADGHWHRRWAAALVKLLLQQADDVAAVNRAALDQSLARWLPRAAAAAHALARLLGPDGADAAGRGLARVTAWLRDLGLTPP